MKLHDTFVKQTREKHLILGGKDPQLRAYSDADWASQAHCHSISGFAIFYGQGVISWSSKKQPIVTLSSTEAVYIALTRVMKDLLWHRKLHSELSPFFTFSTTNPITLFCDNQGTIILSKDSTFHMRTKHIDTHFYFVCEIINNILSISYCPTDEMIADIFTKALSVSNSQNFVRYLELLNHAQLEGECWSTSLLCYTAKSIVYTCLYDYFTYIETSPQFFTITEVWVLTLLILIHLT